MSDEKQELKLSETESQQTAGLRDRIAAVLIKDSFGMTTRTAAYRQADAIITELSLTEEDGVIVGCNHE